MDETQTSNILNYLKSHPIISISLISSISALVLGGYGLWRMSDFQPTSVSPVEFKEPAITLVVDVEGEVVNPGIQEVDVSDGRTIRISDVIALSGGLTPNADAEYLAKQMNLAAEVTDGMKLYVPKTGEVSGAATNTSSLPGKVNINTASESQLMELKGIGETRAKAILKNRPYTGLDDLASKAKLPASVQESIKDEIVF